jgi:hypothetical protein
LLVVQDCIPRESECFNHRCRLSDFCEWVVAVEGCEHLTSGEPCHELCSLSQDSFFGYLDYKYFHKVTHLDTVSPTHVHSDLLRGQGSVYPKPVDRPPACAVLLIKRSSRGCDG